MFWANIIFLNSQKKRKIKRQKMTIFNFKKLSCPVTKLDETFNLSKIKDLFLSQKNLKAHIWV